jgi:hypothetical protein
MGFFSFLCFDWFILPTRRSGHIELQDDKTPLGAQFQPLKAL